MVLLKPNGLRLRGCPDGLEHIDLYQPRGHHPINLDDCIGENHRYRVIHKLGFGATANVWLCQDHQYETPQYVSVKILSALKSTDDCRELRVYKLKEMGLDQKVGGKYVCLPLDRFQIDGPNGTHFCFVYPVLGPRVSRIWSIFDTPDKTLRKVALQAVQAMALLHSHGICHGDFSPSNILLRISGLDGLTREQVIRLLGESKYLEVETTSGAIPTEPTAPKHLVFPVNFSNFDPQFTTDELCVIDFGESFEASNPPKFLGTQQSYCSPELVFDKVAGIESDLWALGCTLFEIRMGKRLFFLYDGDEEEYLIEIVMLLGKLPEPWWTAWKERKNTFEAEADCQGRAIWIDDPATKQPLANKPDRKETTVVPRSIEEYLAEGLKSWGCDLTGTRYNKRDFPEHEIKVFADLLSKILKYNPSDRLTAKAVQDHEWFKMEQEDWEGVRRATWN